MAQLQSAMGGGAPLNLILNYRVPDTNINVQYMYKQGKTNVQFTCVPDDQVRASARADGAFASSGMRYSGKRTLTHACVYV